MSILPFRWNLRKREQLGRLLRHIPEEAFSGYEELLSNCAAKVLAFSGGRKLVFVGRSPENIYDYIVGITEGTSRENRVCMLSISNRYETVSEIKERNPQGVRVLKELFTELGLSPEQILQDPAGVCFTDLVAYGGTFKNIFLFLKDWARDEKQNFTMLKKKISFTGITIKEEPGPNTFRWQKSAQWVLNNPDLEIRNIAIPWILWNYLGNHQTKVSRSNSPERWGSKLMQRPPRYKVTLSALVQAYNIYQRGKTEKTEFVTKLSRTEEFREKWLRSFASELKLSSKYRP